MFSRISTSRVFSVLLVVIFMLAGVFVTPVHAGGVVGNGTPASCTEAALEAALVLGGTITFNCGGYLDIPITSEKLLTVPTTIDGGGKISLVGDAPTRLFNVNTLQPDWPVGFKNITLAYGSADNGGAVYMGVATVWMENVHLDINHASMDGGAIYVNGGSLTLTNVKLTNNTSTQEGGAVYNNGGTLIFNNVTFGGNVASGWGGGLNNNQGTATITDSRFALNVGGINNSDLNGPGGGGIDNYNSTLTVTNSLFDGNMAGTSGGGLRADGGGNISLTNVTFSGNNANYNGGGIYNHTGTMTLTNVTLSDNNAGIGGGVDNNAGTMTLTNVTAYGNQLTGPITLKNTILASSVCVYPFSAITSLGYNLSSDNSCSLFLNQPGDQNNTDPLLGPLQDNGGPTWTHSPQSGSLAVINKGTNSGCPATDQRGVPRPQGAACDIGAVEVASTATVKSVGANDGWVLESTATSNKGGTLNATNSTFTVGDDAAKRQYRGILHFNTAGLPNNAVIFKATLKIMKSVDGSGNTSTLGALLVDMTKPYFGTAVLAKTDFEAVAGKPSVFNAFTKSGNWYSAALKSSGFTYVNRLGVTQFRLRFAKGDDNDKVADFMMFYSGNAANAALRPQLIVEYYLP